LTAPPAATPGWLTSERKAFAAIGLAIFSLAPLVETWRYAAISDWSDFAAAGRHVGTFRLMHPVIWRESWVYTPGAAWLWWPFGFLSPTAGFFVNAVLMLLCAGACAAIASRVYGTSFARAAALVFAWAPTMNATAIGQTTPIGLLFCMLSLWGMRSGSLLLTAVPIGLLLYKPTYAAPLVALLAVRAKWRELGVVAAVAVVWYVLSVAAAAGDWAFVVSWADAIHRWNGTDMAINADKALSVPSLLLRLSVPYAVAVGAGAAIALASLPLLRRLPIVEAGSAACLIGIAASPHAWGYDAVLVLPTIFVVDAVLREPRRTWVLGTAYAVAALLTLTPVLHVDAVAADVLAALVWWFRRYPRAA
jgi:hypothetical protein